MTQKYDCCMLGERDNSTLYGERIFTFMISFFAAQGAYQAINTYKLYSTYCSHHLLGSFL